MNKRETKKITQIMEKAYDFHLSKYHYLFLTQIAMRQYRLRENRKPETLEVTATKVMRDMPELCRKTKGLEHKNIVETSAKRSLNRLEEELLDSDLSEKLQQGSVLENVLNYLLLED